MMQKMKRALFALARTASLSVALNTSVLLLLESRVRIANA